MAFRIHSQEVSPKQDAKAQPVTAANISSRFRRLGIRELGWHAHEKSVPEKLLNRLRAGEAVAVSNIIPVLARLSQRDKSVKSTYLCHPSVQYITKLPNEGSFCGYCNIQMLISYLLGGGVQNVAAFPDGVPSILRLQDLIEEAWDRGFNPEGRIETGGIRGTRKHIGTAEARTLFRSLDIAYQVRRFDSSGVGTTFDALLGYVEGYFAAFCAADPDGKIHSTSAPPMYLQRPRHSMTIVGIETRTNGKRTLLVLDPGLQPSSQMVRAAQETDNGASLDEDISLRPYRRGRWSLGGYREFEMLTLRPTQEKG